MDGHAKSMKVSLMTATEDPSVAGPVRRAGYLGNLIKPGCPLGSACQDYYFEVTKTTPN